MRNQICSNLRKLAKLKYFCKSIFAKAYLRKLAKIHAFCTCKSLRKHNLRNLAKSVFIDSPTPAPGPPQNLPPEPGPPQRLHTLRRRDP